MDSFVLYRNAKRINMRDEDLTTVKVCRIFQVGLTSLNYFQIFIASLKCSVFSIVNVAGE